MKYLRSIPAISVAILLILAGLLVAVNLRAVHAQDVFPAQLFAPYNDVTLNGSSLQTFTKNTGQKYFTLAFITNGGGSCNAEWGGTVPLDQTSTYLPNLNSDIQYVRSQGGDVIVSFGGASGQELAQSCNNASSLQAQYQAIINQYHVARLDFDIEGGAEGDATSYTRRNASLADLQRANPGLAISFTLPSATTGLLDTSLGMLRNAISQGVNIRIVNLMTMDYGSPDSQMGQEAVNAANSLHSQLQSLYPTKTSSELWSMVGITPMIGQNDTRGEIFSLQDAQTVLAFAQQKQIGELSMWEASRDKGGCAGSAAVSVQCSGIAQGSGAFANIFRSFTGGSGSTTTSANNNHVLAVATGTQTSTNSNNQQTPQALTSTASSGDNVLSNAGFEQGDLSSWQCDTNDAVVTTPVHGGTHALQITPTNSTTGQCTQTVTVQADHTYTLSAYVQGNYAFLGIENGVSNWTSSPGYTRLSVQFTTGNSTSVTIYIHGWYAQGNVFADDFSLQ